VAANFSTVTGLFHDETAASTSDDPVAEIVDLAS